MNTKSKITYRTVGDYLIPNITIPVNDDLIPLAKWGMAHKEYLMNNKRVLFIIMLTKWELYDYLSEVDKQADELFSCLVNDMGKSEGVTEQLKEENQMLWVQRMNNIHERAVECINNELIYNYT